MVEADVVAYLAAAGLGLTAGTNLFEGPLPEDLVTDPIVSVSHYNSQRSDQFVMSPSLTPPGYEFEDFQVMVRSAVKATAESTALAIHNKLDNLGTTANFGGSGRIYFHIDSGGPPRSLFQDKNFRWRRAADYTVRKARG